MDDNINRKIHVFKQIIENVYTNVQNNVDMSIIAYQNYIDFIDKFNIIINQLKYSDNTIINLQKLNDLISQLLKIYGSINFLDIITICFDNDYIISNNFDENKLRVILKYCKPFGYSVLKWNSYKNNKNNKNNKN